MVELSARAISWNIFPYNRYDKVFILGEWTNKEKREFYILNVLNTTGISILHTSIQIKLNALILYGLCLYWIHRMFGTFCLQTNFIKNTETQSHIIRHTTLIPSSTDRLPMPCDGKCTHTNQKYNDGKESHHAHNLNSEMVSIIIDLIQEKIYQTHWKNDMETMFVFVFRIQSSGYCLCRCICVGWLSLWMSGCLCNILVWCIQCSSQTITDNHLDRLFMLILSSFSKFI